MIKLDKKLNLNIEREDEGGEGGGNGKEEEEGDSSRDLGRGGRLVGEDSLILISIFLVFFFFCLALWFENDHSRSRCARCQFSLILMMITYV